MLAVCLNPLPSCLADASSKGEPFCLQRYRRPISCSPVHSDPPQHHSFALELCVAGNQPAAGGGASAATTAAAAAAAAGAAASAPASAAAAAALGGGAAPHHTAASGLPPLPPSWILLVLFTLFYIGMWVRRWLINRRKPVPIGGFTHTTSTLLLT